MEIRICRSCDHDLRWHHRPRHQFNPGTSEVVLQPIVAISPSGDQVAIQWPGESKWVQVTRLAADDHSISMVEHGRLPNDWGQTQPNRPSPAEESYQRHVIQTLSGSGFARCQQLTETPDISDSSQVIVTACNGVIGVDGRCLKAASHFRPASAQELDELAAQAWVQMDEKGDGDG
jgi:hypothetical protein